MADIGTEINWLVVKLTGVPAYRVVPSARLLHDLGVDGDDAAELFAEVANRFGTDLTGLGRQWGRHFHAEGEVPWSWPGSLSCIGLAVLAVMFARSLLDLGTFLLVTVPSVWAVRRFVAMQATADAKSPITVADVVAAVEAGAWPEQGSLPLVPSPSGRGLG